MVRRSNEDHGSKLRILSSELSEIETGYGLSVMEINEYMWLKQVMWAR